MKSNSKVLMEKSVSSAVSAIEIYNKPNFMYREETFSILMVNAWELLLKAIIVNRNNNKMSSIYFKKPIIKKDGSNSKKVKIATNRSGTPKTIGIFDSIDILERQYRLVLDKACKENLNLLIEIRDNSVHFRIDDKLLSKKIQEIGTASLKNYLKLINEVFGLDLSSYNFYLMPLSFFHEFEYVESFSINNRENKQLLEFISSKEKEFNSSPESPYNISLRLNTKFVRSTDLDSLNVKISSDPNAIPITLKDEDITQRFPWDYSTLTRKLKTRYLDFKQNEKFNLIMRELKQDYKYCKIRFLDPANKSGLKKEYYNPEIQIEIDKHYSKK